jgi:uncharacterized protein with ParB-like and HNH nuclease domain/predicted transport protein
VKAAEANLLKFLKRSDQLEIPIYQRTYSWTRRECQQLWSDIIRTAGGDEGHFIGSIVYIDTGVFQVMGTNAIEVIDGQQRMTTLSLLLLALARGAEENGGGLSGAKLIRDYLLQEDDADPGDEERYKLLPTKGDRETYKRLVDGLELPESPAARLVDAYRFFEEQVRRTPLSPTQILEGIEKLLIVDIALERDHDNPQLIFESLNSTGLDLSQADLIRNYVLMGLPSKQQNEIYTKSWHPLEQLFPTEQAELFDRFVRDYLTMKTGQIPKIDQVYESFKAFARGSDDEVAAVVADVYHHAKNWVKLSSGRTEDVQLAARVADINQLKIEVVYPFLMEVLDDYGRGTITHAAVLEMFELVESYVFRRAIAGLPTNVLNKTFAALAREIDKDNYVESLKAVFVLKESYARMPTDEEFRSAFVVKDVYNFRNRNYLLRKLENFDHKEPINVDSFTIEHVMPQNPDLSPEWQQELGPEWATVQERYLHTIGNLTLTGYNSELSDKPFHAKRTMAGGFRDSHLRLNNYLAQLEHWNEHQIQTRAELLADIALQIWQAPVVAPDILARYRKPKPMPGGTYTLADHPELQSEAIAPVFDELRRRVLNLDAGVHEEVRKQYVAYKFATNFVCVVPLKSELKLYLNIALAELNDPDSRAADVSGIGHWGTGDVLVRLTDASELDAVLDLVRQAFEKQGEDGGEEPQWSQAGVEAIVEQATDADAAQALLSVVESAVRNGLYPRPWKRSIMFAPPANRSRALFTLSLREDDQVDLYVSAEAFTTFYSLDTEEIEQHLGPPGPTTLTAHEVDALGERLDELMANAVATETAKSTPTWNGRDFYVVLGERDWEDCMQYGFVAAGGGPMWTKPLELLYPGARVFAYKPSPVKGYVGVGRVTGEVMPIRDFRVQEDGVEKPILDAQLRGRDLFAHDADDLERCEYVVPVEWTVTKPTEEAVWEAGLFANQMTVCRLRDRTTLEHLEAAFELRPAMLGSGDERAS